MSEALIEARGIGRRAADRWLLDDVTWTVQSGERVALAGPSGSGKTLLLRALAMLDPLDAGEIRWRGGSVRGRDVPRFRSRVIYLHQRPSLGEGTVEQALQQPFQLRIHRDKAFDRGRIISLLESLGRDQSFLSQRHRELSGGESQLTALLRAMQLDPDVLLLDEPTAALDEASTATVEALVNQWLLLQPSRPRALVWVTHDLQQARRIGNTVRRLHKGRWAEES